MEKMMETIIVNGKKYNAVTGKLIDAPTPDNHQAADFKAIHQGVQKSQTLNRRFVAPPKRQTAEQTRAISQFKRRHDILESGRNVTVRIERKAAVERSDKIHRFQPATTYQNQKTDKNSQQDDLLPPQKHPLEIQARRIMLEKSAKKTTLKPKDIKNQAISQALEKMRTDIANENSKNQVKASKKLKKPRGVNKKSVSKFNFASFAAGFCVLVLGVGYLTYLSLPEISTRVAAIQAGYDVNLPAYKPEGYNLKGLAIYDGNSVNVRFGSGNSSFTLKQAKSSWDSLALLDKFVAPKWDSDYIISQEKGIVIYKNSRSEAVWVNNGKLYSISGANNLTSDQINKIATSF